MTIRARAEFDPQRFGVRVIVSPREGQVIRWGEPIVSKLDPDVLAPDDAWLRLDEDMARAIYETLADHFGHSGHDTRALRKDYDAERVRVDTFIKHLTKTTP